jgi:DNA-binding NarL/FixJ family response regulator
MPSVLIVANDLLVRQGLKHMLGQEHRDLVFGEAKGSEDAAICLAKRPWDIAVVDVSIPGEDGFRFLQEIRRSHPSTRVLVLSLHTYPDHAARARQLHARGYVHKNAGRAVFLKAFKSVLAGEEHFEKLSPRETSARPQPKHARLSPREQAVLSAIVAGKRLSEIAAELNLSVQTVSTYKRRIFDKLGVHSAAELFRYAIDHHLAS